MTVIEQYMALPALDMSHIREYFDTHLKDKMDGLAFCLYYSSIITGYICGVRMLGMIPIFKDRTPSNEEIDLIASDTHFIRLYKYLEQDTISAVIFEDLCIDLDKTTWFDLEGNSLLESDCYLGWDSGGLSKVGRYSNPDLDGEE